MPTISLDMYQTLGIAVVVLLIGSWLKKRIKFLDKFCVPAPVIGGLLYALIMLVLHVNNVIDFNYDETLKNICMVIFFTSVGFQANIKILKKGGVSLIIFLVIVVGMIFAQNGLSVLVAKFLGMDPMLGLCTGSIPRSANTEQAVRSTRSWKTSGSPVPRPFVPLQQPSV